MQKDTKQEILDAARQLFNECGYNSVSLRDIASAVGISKGNLTYHFSKKEEIMESLIEATPDTFSAAPPRTLEELDMAFLDMQSVVQQNLYFFLYVTQLAQASPELYRKQRVRYQELLQKLKKGFHYLRETGLLRSELFAGEYDHTIDTLYMTTVYWAPFSALKQSIAMDCVEYRRHAWSVMYHLLTEEGRRKLQDMIQM